MKLASLHTLSHVETRTCSQGTLSLGNGISLLCGRMHEVTGPAADMFAVLAAERHQRSCVWVALGRDLSSLCPSGLQAYLDIQGLVLVEAVSRAELLWAADQALRAEGGFCVIVDMPTPLSLDESRRFQLSAEEGGGIGLVLLRDRPSTSAAQTRWQCRPTIDMQPAWVWECTKGKSGEAGCWLIKAQGDENATDTLHMAATASA